MLEVIGNVMDEEDIFDSIETKDIFEALFVEENIDPEDAMVIYDFPKYVVTRNSDIYYLRGKSQKLAKVKPTKRSHPTVNLVGSDDVRRGKLISRIVASAFISRPPSPSHRVFHRDGDTTNNAVNNLYWSSRSPAKESRMINAGTKTLSHAILDEEEVLSVYNSLLEGKTLRVIGNNYGVTPQTIQMIKDGLTWKHVITKKMLFYLRGIVTRDKPSIKQYMLSRSGSDDVLQVPNEAYGGGEDFVSNRLLYLTNDGKLFELTEVTESDRKKFGIDNSYVLISTINAKKTVTISKTPFSIPLLIARTFHKSPKEGEYLNYKDGNALNLSRDNLEWVKYRVGRNSGRGRVLDVDKVSEVKKLLGEGIPVKEIADTYKVSRSAVYKIKNGESWSWVS